MQRLLVVEDDNSVRSTITTFLELEGYAVDAVSSTREALDRLRQARSSGLRKRRVAKSDVDAGAARIILERWFSQIK